MIDWILKHFHSTIENIQNILTLKFGNIICFFLVCVVFSSHLVGPCWLIHYASLWSHAILVFCNLIIWKRKWVAIVAFDFQPSVIKKRKFSICAMLCTFDDLFLVNYTRWKSIESKGQKQTWAYSSKNKQKFVVQTIFCDQQFYTKYVVQIYIKIEINSKVFPTFIQIW